MVRPKNKPSRNLLFWIAAGILIALVWSLIQSPSAAREDINFSRFIDLAEQGRVSEVTISDNQVEGRFRDGTEFKTVIPSQYDDLVPILRTAGVEINVKDTSRSPWFSYLFGWFPILLLIAFWLFFMRQMQSGGNKAMSFGKSKAKLFSGVLKKVTFNDVAGVEEAEEELQEIIGFLKDPQKFQKLGGRIPKGVLLVGAPGTGKTLLARAVAGEANVPFYSISGSDFVEMFVGVGASRVRDLFEQAKKQGPCLIFIDEIDAVGRSRGAGLGGGHDEREQTLNQLLVEMDGFDSNEGTIVIAATNRPDILDSALLRPGRFDRRIVVPMPDVKGREEILNVHMKKIPMAEDVNLKVIARSTPGFSGADLANLINEAALQGARFGQETVTMKDMEYAKDKVLMGVERKSMIVSDEEKRNTAYHEAGHALVAALIPEADPIHKVTIIPRGLALGLTQQLPLDDRYTYTKDYLEAQLSVLLAGRVTETLFLNKTTTGAANDFEKATEIARKMVCQWGMSDLGPMTFGDRDELIFLGRDLAMNKNYSEKTSERIDEEVKGIIMRCYARANELLETHSDKLKAIADLLLEREVLSSDEIMGIVNGGQAKDRTSESEKPAASGAVPPAGEASAGGEPSSARSAAAPEKDRSDPES